MSAIIETPLLPVLAALGYLSASVAYGAHVLLRKQSLIRWGRSAIVIGAVSHTAAIGVHCVLSHQTPFTTPGQTLSASAWAIAITYLILEAVIRPAPTALGAIAMPAAFLSLFAGSELLRPAAHAATTDTSRLLNSSMVSLHVMALLSAFALLVLAFGCATLYLIQHRMLKRKRVSGRLFGKLPPLNRLENLAFVLVVYAYPLLTLGLGAGAIAAWSGAVHGNWLEDKRILASLAMWLVYGCYLTLHRLAHLRGPRASYLLMGGLVIALITFLAPSTAHNFAVGR